MPGYAFGFNARDPGEQPQRRRPCGADDACADAAPWFAASPVGPPRRDQLAAATGAGLMISASASRSVSSRLVSIGWPVSELSM